MIECVIYVYIDIPQFLLAKAHPLELHCVFLFFTFFLLLSRILVGKMDGNKCRESSHADATKLCFQGFED